MPSMTRARALACVALLTLMGFSLGFSELVVIGIEPELAGAFHVPLERVGDLISWFSVAYAVCTPVLAVVTGRFRRYHLLVVYVSLFCAANLMALLAPDFGTLLASRVLLGAVSGALLAVGITYIPELVGVHRMSMAISVVYAAFSVAMVVSTSLGRIIAGLFHWQVAMVVALALAVAVGVALVAMLPRSGGGDGPVSARDQLRLLHEPQVLTCVGVFAFGVGSVYVFYGYITPYLEDLLGMGSVAAGGVLMAYGVVCFVSNLASGWLDMRFGLRGLLVTFPVQAALLLVLYLVTPAMPATLATMLLIALSMYVVSVPCVSLFMRTARRRHPGAMTLASSMEPMSFNIGIAFGTAVGGAAVAGPGLRVVGLIGAAFSLVAWGFVLATWLLERRADRRDGLRGA